MELQQYDFNIKHRPGKANANADALSRMNERETTNECYFADIEFVEIEDENTPQLEEALNISKCHRCNEERPYLEEYNNGWVTLLLCQSCIQQPEQDEEEGPKEICERCEKLDFCGNEWDIFRGFNSYCSIIGTKCYINDGHHTHRICNSCAHKLNDRHVCNAQKLQAQREEDERCINRAKQYTWEKCDYIIEERIINNNRQVTRDLRMEDKDRPKYKNHCENCGTLLNSWSQKWMLFSYPSPYNQYYVRSDILTCKTCFQELAEEYFGMEEEIYQNILTEVIKPLEELEAMEIDKPTQEEESELTTEPWWTEPIDVQMENYYQHTEDLMQDIRLVANQSLF